MNICSKCGNIMEDNEIFCSKCKTLVSSANEEKSNVCPKCQNVCEPDDVFCGECGFMLNGDIEQPENVETEPTIDARMLYGNDRSAAVNAKKYENAQTAAMEVKEKPGKYNFVENDETAIATLGSGYLQNIVSGNVSSIKAVLTQKRVYLCGKCLEKNGKIWSRRKISRIIEVEDITGTGFEYANNIIWLILGIFIAAASVLLGIILGLAVYEEYFIILLFALASIPFFIINVLQRRTLFQIEYAGGKIGFDVKWLNPQESMYFQRQIHLIKAKRKMITKNEV